MLARRPLRFLRELLLKVDHRVLLISAAVLVGMSSSLAALLLNRGIEALTEGLAPVRHLWWSLLLPGLGATLGVLFLQWVVRESPGHGVPEVIVSVSRRGGALPTTASFSRLVATVASTVAHRLEPTTFYLDDLIRRGQLLRPGTDARVLADLQVEELLERDCVSVPEGMRLRDLVEVVKTSRRNFFPVLAAGSGEFAGLLHLDDLRPYLFSPELYDAVVAAEIMDPDPPLVHPGDDLNQVLDRMDQLGRFSMPVVDGGRFLGMISKATLLDRYRRELLVQTDQPPVL